MATLKRRFKIAGAVKDSELSAMPFGRQIEHLRTINEFKAAARSVWISQKRRSNAAAISEARKLYDAKEWLCEFHDEPMYRDDSFQFWYR